MSCCGLPSLVARVVIIAALGVGAGLIDSARRPPLKLGGREAPHPVELGSETPNTGEHSSSPTPPTPQPPAAEAKKPGEPGWTKTPEAGLPKGQITLDAAKRLFDSGASFVDARRKEDYELGHIKGAIRINLKSFENGDPPLLAMIPRDANVVVYCSGGNCDESEHVAEFLSNSGYAKVYVIHDGYPGWNAGMHWPIETGEGIQ